MSPGKWYIPVQFKYTRRGRVPTGSAALAAGTLSCFLSSQRGLWRDEGGEWEFTGGLGPGCPQKFCCRRFLASMASRMGCRFDWYFCRISSISCSIMGSRARSLFWRSSTVQLFSYERGRQHSHDKARVSGFWRQPSLLFFFFWPCHLACGILVPWPGIEPAPLALKVWGPNHWNTREIPPREGF